jgi:glycosyltransferase involved in cell wall biosynthesis
LKAISICIPTYNRATKLAECLEHLCSFVDQDFEVVIGDNCSTDQTDEVIAIYSKRLLNLVYLKHRSNLGFARNMDAILRRASRDHLYILNDDDIVFENALDLAIRLMVDPEVMGVVGDYYSFRQLNPDLTVTFDDAVVTTVGQKAYAALLDNLSLCDGHPILRRSAFHRHCEYLDRTGTLIPLYFKLISLGKVLSVNKPFFQHRTTGESLTARMAESWFLDMANADIELAVQQSLEFLPLNALANARHRLLHTLYFQAARMSITRKQPYLLWFFLRRLAGLGELSQEIAVLSEHYFCHDILMERIHRQIQDSQISCVIVVKNSLCSKLALQWGAKVIVCDNESQAIALRGVDNAVWLDDLAIDTTDNLPVGVSTLSDALLKIRLSQFSCEPIIIGDRLQLHFFQKEIQKILSEPNASFQVLCAPYSEV